MFQRPTPKNTFFGKKKRHFICTGRMQILPNYFVRGHRWNAEGAATLAVAGGIILGWTAVFPLDEPADDAVCAEAGRLPVSLTPLGPLLSRSEIRFCDLGLATTIAPVT